MNIVLLGAPGSGKGTQSLILCKKFNLYCLMMGALARIEASMPTPLGAKISEILNSGSLLNDEMFVILLKKGLSKNINEFKGILFDGVVRTLNEAVILDESMKEMGLGSIDYVIEISVSITDVQNRILNRLICKNCNASYSLRNYSKDFCELCKENLVKRSDDNLKALQSRIDGYFDMRQKIVDYYSGNGIQINIIDGCGNVEDVSANILSVLQNT
ncbi:adenylate kinase family protein [Candidatus Gromoviella agglomerans]|uniref:adenylate kinase family protein n=1 Tax=Candidatus Gromoviella agglomerans TaxID=2806609 RepID=UPI001E6316CF|nr:nucleoside monophosphate kinase [Candidatus Gromoviella agglomerans]UFX98579.1 Adenylate kinase [Candidatus Gromoviella agglomerans]